MARTHLTTLNGLNALRSFWISVRPKTLVASLCPVALAAALADHGPNANLHYLPLVALCAVAMQMAANLANDYYDVGRGVDDHRIGPLRSLQRGEITPPQLKGFFIGCFACALVLGLYLSWARGVELFALGMACLLVAYGYTGGPFPLSHWMLGEVAAGLFFGPVAVLGTLWAVQGHFALRDVFLSLPPGLIAALMMGLNNQRDARTDAAAAKRTFASVWGEGVGRACNLCCLLMTAILPPLYLKLELFHLSPWVLLATWPPFALFITHWWNLLRGARERELTAILGATGKYGVLYHLGLAIAVKL